MDILNPPENLKLTGAAMSRELEIVEKIMLGIDPAGRGDPLTTPKDPALDKARAIYYEQLKRVSKQHAPAASVAAVEKDKPSGSRRGERWTIAEDNRLEALWDTSPVVTTVELSAKLGRTRTAVIARLVKLGFFEQISAAMAADNARLEAAGGISLWSLSDQNAICAVESAHPVEPANAGSPWSSAADEELRSLWEAPEQLTCEEIGTRLGRTRGAIVARLVRLGFFADRDEVRRADLKRH
ncbi:hypothetical protein [uncultured Aquitalea sp.]|uniref:hypothetical protein n=1 Tax=uncultured Aquitalea sp. TaxID=540272 RepID=UPI0025D365C3|nr:hypothetical protein [uncultured Aquitalea sp.]